MQILDTIANILLMNFWVYWHSSRLSEHQKGAVMRICSLLPSASEILYALGLDEHIVGVSHTCDYPQEAKGKPTVTRSVRDVKI